MDARRHSVTPVRISVVTSPAQPGSDRAPT